MNSLSSSLPHIFSRYYLSVSLSHTHTHTRTHTHAHTHMRTLSHAHTHTHAHSLSLTHTHTLSLSLSLGHRSNNGGKSAVQSALNEDDIFDENQKILLGYQDDFGIEEI